MNKVSISAAQVTVITEPLSKEEVMRKVAAPLLAAGIVKDSYPDAIVEREKGYPTGLPTEGVGVAIPHTDIIHVNQAGVAVGVLHHPVTFQNMADPDDAIEVRVLFMLALDEPHGQIEMLQKLTELLQNADLLKQLSEAASPAEAWALVEGPFRSMLLA